MAKTRDPLVSASGEINNELWKLTGKLAAISPELGLQAKNFSEGVREVLAVPDGLMTQQEAMDPRGPYAAVARDARCVKWADTKAAAMDQARVSKRVLPDMARALVNSLERELDVPTQIPATDEVYRTRAVELLRMVTDNIMRDPKLSDDQRPRKVAEAWLSAVEQHGGPNGIVARVLAGPWGEAYVRSFDDPGVPVARETAMEVLRSQLAESGTPRQRAAAELLGEVLGVIVYADQASEIAEMRVENGPQPDQSGPMVIQDPMVLATDGPLRMEGGTMPSGAGT